MNTHPPSVPTRAHADEVIPRDSALVPNHGARLRLLLMTDTAIHDTGGSERFLRTLSSGLDQDRYRIDVVQLTAPPPANARAMVAPRRDGVRLEYLPIGAVYGLRAWRAYLELRRRVLRGDYDIIQSQHEKADLLCALLPRGPGPAIRISNRRDDGFQKSGRLRATFRVLNGRFDWIIAPSQAVLDKLKVDERVSGARTRCLPNGVDVDRFKPADAATRRRGRLALELKPDAFLFGCVARMVPVKRHQDLIEAFAIISTRHPEAELVLIGSGPLETSLHERATIAGLRGRVHFMGERSDVDRLLPMLDAFLLCSSTEGMSNAVLEAMACGLPVIATAVGGNPETIEDGSTGTLVPQQQPERIAAAMISLLQDRPRSNDRGRKARRRVQACFSIEAMVGRFDRLYRDCRRPEPQPSAPTVWHLRSSVGLYGAEQVLLELCSEQKRRGQRVVLAAFSCDGESAPALVDAAAAIGLDARVVPCCGAFDLRCLRSLRAQLAEASRSGEHVLHCHDYKSVVYGLLATIGLRMRRIATVHGWVDDGVRARAYRALEVWALRSFDQVCAVSDAIAARLRRAGLKEHRLRRVDNGVDLGRFRLRDAKHVGGVLSLGTAARLSPEKNLVQLVTALAECRARGVSVRLTVLGEGPMRPRLEALIARLDLADCVHLPGARDAMHEWYPQLDALVLPSLTEGMPLTVLEALACGCPVVASDVGEMPAMIERLPGCRIVPVGDLDALVEALCKVAPRARPDPRLRQRVIDRYSGERMADAYDEVYRRAIAA